MTYLIDPPKLRPGRPDRTITAADRPAPKRTRWWRDGFRPLLLRLHFYVGVFVGPFVMIAAVTGLLYALTPQLEQVVHRRELTVDQVRSSTIPIADQVSAGQRAVPDGTLIEVRPPRSIDGTTRVTFRTPDLDPDHDRTAFVDPYTGQVRGVLTTFGEWLPVRTWFDSLHRTLLLGDVGRVYSELAASWLWVLALSGLGIWLVRTRNQRRLRRTLLPQTGGRGRGRLLTWHGAFGLWAAVGMLFLSATGLTWSQFAGANVSELRSQLNWTKPVVDTTLPAAALPGTKITIPAVDQPATTQRVLETAYDNGLTGPLAVTPGEAGQAWTVSQVKRSWPAQQDSIALDPGTGQVLHRVDFDDWPIAAKLARWGIDAHMGLLFGLANQLALAALAVGLICMISWGYRMWWHRRPTRAGGRRTAPALGGNQTPSRVALLTLTGLAIPVAIFAPVLGGSLLIFLTLDAVRCRLVRTEDRYSKPQF